TEPPPAAHDAGPAWSPDGSRVAFSRALPGRTPDLFVVDADGAGLRRLTSGDPLEASPAWSPDGSRVAFERCCPNGSSEIYTVDVEGGVESNLTASPAHEASPAWSPDGARIAFVRAPASGGRDLYTMDAAGDDVRRVTSHPRADLAPTWLPTAGEPPSEPAVEPAAELSAAQAAPGGSSAIRRPRGEQPVREPLAARRITQRGRRIADGVRLIRAVHRGVPQRVFALRVNPRRRHAIDTALAGDRLAGRRRTRQIVRANRALAGVNGDFSLPSGSPVHAFLSDGDLKRTTPTAGVQFAVSRGQRRLFLGWGAPGLRLLETSSSDRFPIARWNDGSPVVGEVAGFTAAGRGVMRPPSASCAVRLRGAGPIRWTEDGSLEKAYTVERAGCFASRLTRRGGVVLAAPFGTAEAVLLRSIRREEVVHVSWGFGWPRAFDSIGGTPLLVEDGRVVATSCGASFCARHPRTAVGITRTGKVLLVVVDGRRPRWSRGMTLVELAREMRRLGAVSAVNLDGGGSSTMVVRDRLVNRPSDPTGERAVSSAVLLLRGRDRQPRPEEPAPLGLSSAKASLDDPASTGGLLEALERDAFATWRR
ncbi:MAG TPA: phosphodiester glycosidase family protein, partial [Actinomycetota bacterium]